MPGFNPEDWNARHFRNTEKFAAQVEALFRAAILEALRIAAKGKRDPGKPFSFDDLPGFKGRVQKMLADLAGGVRAVIGQGTTSEWALANAKNDAFLQSILETSGLPEDAIRQFLPRNADALSAFQGRKIAGMSLSNRVWQYTNQFKTEIELAIEQGLGDGRPGAELSRDVRQYLKEPDRLFRRVRNSRGQLVLSKAARAYNPGAGIYRSSYKNALRLTRTEINMAYREADYLDMQDLDFVVGFEVRRSNRGYQCDVCELLKGRYPKTFKFIGWHPQCMCHVVTILASREEMDRLTEMTLAGEDTANFRSANEVTDMPRGFTEWIEANRQRLLTSKNQPYFVRDNFTSGTVAKGLRLASKPMPPVVAKTRAWAPEFGRRSEEIARELGVKVTPVSRKSEARILEKAKSDYSGDVSLVRDIIRNTFIAKAALEVEVVVARLRSSFNVVKLRRQTPENDILGYSGVLLQIENAGVYAESQINTAQMIYAKEVDAEVLLGKALFEEIRQLSGVEPGLGHKYYEEFRVLKHDPGDGKRKEELKKLSREYYDRLRNISL